MLARGVNVAMGTDSTAINDDDDFLQEMRLVSKLHRQPGLEQPAITMDQVLTMAAPTPPPRPASAMKSVRWNPAAAPTWCW